MILAVETATEICSTAIVHSGKTLASRSVNEKNIHSERLMTLIDEILREASVSKNNLEGIAVSIGPGSFTGLRIGLSSAKGLALALGIPLFAVPTLDGIAEQYRRTRKTEGAETFCALIDAKRNESFFCFYSISVDAAAAVTGYGIKERTEIANEISEKNAIVFQQPCDASAVGVLAERKHGKLRVEDYSLLEPLYLRDFVVTQSKK